MQRIGGTTGHDSNVLMRRLEIALVGRFGPHDSVKTNRAIMQQKMGMKRAWFLVDYSLVATFTMTKPYRY